MSKDRKSKPLKIGGKTIAPGSSERFDLFAARLPTHTELAIPLHIFNGKYDGPKVWLSAAVHGDELNGVEIIRRVVEQIDEPLQCGAVIAIPIVNVFGFIGQSRYLPDRRDLNRSFPGSKTGSLASRMAHLFMTEIVSNCSHGIDLHTASMDRTNFPQIRGDLSDPETLRCAEAFRAPVMIHSQERTGSLRSAASKKGVASLVYEAGEAQRFNGNAIDIGVAGVFGVLNELGIVRSKKKKARKSQLVEKSTWVRARKGGILRLDVAEGDMVEAKQVIGQVSDAFGNEASFLRSPFRGLVIGMTLNPLVHQGDAVVHVGHLKHADVDLGNYLFDD